MPSRRGSRGGGSQASSSRRANTGDIRRNTRNRQAPSRYGQASEGRATPGIPQVSEDPESDTEQEEQSEYTQTLPGSVQLNPPSELNQSDILIASPASQQSSQPPSGQEANPIDNEPFSLKDVRHLLRSHEQDIADQVVCQLRSNNSIPCITPSSNHSRRPTPLIPENTLDPTLARITELETQLAQLQAERQLGFQSTQPQREFSTFNPVLSPITQANESASEGIESVETLFPGVEQSTLAQIIENRFKPTNIYRLFATEKERAEAQRTISIGGIEFERTERDGKENEYRMSSFFKAWAAYSGILVKLAPYALQGELAISLFLYTMSLYDLLEKYAWDGVKSYHFQFHRKRIASGKSIYLPDEWRRFDSELIASSCFAYPATRNT